MQAAIEHVDDLVLEPGHVAPAHADHGAGDDLTHIPGGVVQLQHVLCLPGEVLALPLRLVQGAADVLAGLAEETCQGQLVVQLSEEGRHVGV